MIVILKNGVDKNKTIATIRFDRYGTRTYQNIYTCDEWQEGIENTTDEYLLLVRSGTLFTDWNRFTEILSNYPHKGIIAHLNRNNSFHDQCLFIKRDLLHLVNLETCTFTVPRSSVSEKNIHHDYTPTWANYGGQFVVNFNNQIRGIKLFKQPGDFSEYFNLAESQLWVLNNEPVNQINARRILMPGSGLYWIKQAAYTDSDIHIMDISTSQVNFCNYLLENWNGENYAEHTRRFILKNKIKHYNPKQFEFEVDLPIDFAHHWQNRTSNVRVEQGDMIPYVIKNHANYDYIWRSNVNDYKWTMLKHPAETCNKFMDIVNAKAI